MSESSNKILLIDEYKEPLKLMESYDTPSGINTGAVLATLFGTLSDFSEMTRNGRWYTGSLWKKVLDDPLLKEQLQYKNLAGEADHPLDIENRLETHIPYISHMIREPRINEGKQCVEGYIDILDTPNGRIVKTLLDYGTTIGVSSRGSGDLTHIDGKTVVDENSYTFITWDIVARPSNRKARVHEIDTVNSEGRTAFESMKSQIHTMIENKDTQSLKLTESLISKTDIPDKEVILKMINEGFASSEAEGTPAPEFNGEVVPKSDLDEAYQRILELKSENSELDDENKSLKKSLEESENTISDLNGLNKNLSSMVSSYMESLSEEDLNTIEGQKVPDDEKEKNEDIVEPELQVEVNYDEVLDAIDQSNDEVMNKLSEMTQFIRQSVKTNELRQTNESLKDQLQEMVKKNSELQEKLKDSRNENTRLVKYGSSVINEYFKLRCSQLGLNEQVARKQFVNRLYEYEIKDINEVLTELYSTTSTSNKRINESTSNSGSLGTLSLTGTMKSKSTDDDQENSEEMDGLIESIRQVRQG